MRTAEKNQGTINKVGLEYYLPIWIESFLLDRKAQNLAGGTVEFYRKKLRYFADFMDARSIKEVTQITASDLRNFLIYLDEQGHNAGGTHACYRTVKTFLRWFEDEAEPDGWNNPIKKIKAPRIGQEPLDPVDPDVVKGLVATCDLKTMIGCRDKALLLLLLDTGARAQEALDLNLEDVNAIKGDVLIRQGKGRKPRTVYLGRVTRKALRNYLKFRQNIPHQPALWVKENGERLTYWGLVSLIKRRSSLAGVQTPSVHSFRRAFALSMLRARVDPYRIKTLMGHADLQVLQRYLKLTDLDLQQAHNIGSPADNL